VAVVVSRPAKAVIVAAGQGKRCRPYTDTLPKCLLPVNGKSILEHQLAALKANGVTAFSLVRGHQADKFAHPGIRYYDNPSYEHNNILHSLMIAEEDLDGDCLVSYGDIVYTAGVVRAAAQSPGDLAVVVDTAWRARYANRSAHPVSEAEKAIADRQGRVLEIGKHIADSDAVLGEFIGLVKLSSKGCRLFRQAFHEAREQYDGRPFQRAKTFRDAYLTDMLQEMIQRGIPVHAVSIQGDWVEIDTVEDYEYAQVVFKGALP
jgi:choline kinase